MKFSSSFKNVKVDHILIKEHCEYRLNKLEKYLNNPSRANVHLHKLKYGFSVEVIIHSKNLHFQSQSEERELFVALDKAFDRLSSQLERKKAQFSDRKKKLGRVLSLEEYKEKNKLKKAN